MSKSLTQTSRDDHSHIIISTDYSTEVLHCDQDYYQIILDVLHCDQDYYQIILDVLHCDQDYYQIILDTEEKEVSEVLKY